ncbi:hypothetical protein D3C76_1183740 [compost metagenome]
MGGKGADVTVYPIRTGEQQAGHAFEYSWDSMDILQSRRAGHAKVTSSDVAILTHDQYLRYLGIVIKELEQTLDHALGMGGVVRILPEEQCDTQSGGIASTQNIRSGARVFRLFGWRYRKHRNRPVGHRVTG